MLVLDEAFDCWEHTKNPNDYGKYFKDWWQRDLDSMILRDRNHPSVILWSIGNEINERAEESGYVIARQLSDEVRRLDPTRPVTEAICGFWDHPGRQWSDTDDGVFLPRCRRLQLPGRGIREGPPEIPQSHHRRHRIVSQRHCEFWRVVEKDPWVLGDFVWTGMDYLGEAGVGAARID